MVLLSAAISKPLSTGFASLMARMGRAFFPFVHLAVGSVQDFIERLPIRPLDCADAHAQLKSFQVVGLVPFIESPVNPVRNVCCSGGRSIRQQYKELVASVSDAASDPRIEAFRSAAISA